MPVEVAVKLQNRVKPDFGITLPETETGPQWPYMRTEIMTCTWLPVSILSGTCIWACFGISIWF